MRFAPIVLLLAAPVLAAQAQELKPGKYDIEFTSDLPALAGRKVKESECLTKKDIDGGLLKLGVDPDNKSCKVSDLRRSPGKVSFRVACTQEGRTSTGEASATYGADSFDFSVVNRTALQDKPFTHRKVGKRAGDCK
jgi:hypothetical protein